MRSSSVLALSLVTSACEAEPPIDESADDDQQVRLPPGERCDEDDDDTVCSTYCSGGVCMDTQECIDDDDCSLGFRCEVTFVFGSCEPTCAVCPHQTDPRWICHDDYGCSYSGDVYLDAGGPYSGEVGRPLALAGIIEARAGRTLVVAEWRIGDVTIPWSYDAEYVFDRPFRNTILLVGEDDRGADASEWAEVDVCASTDVRCELPSDCCDGLDCATSGDEHRRVAPQ